MIAEILYIYLILVLFCIPFQVQKLESSGFRDLPPDLQASKIYEFWYYLIFVPIACFLCFIVLIFSNKERPQEYLKIFMLILFLGWGLKEKPEEPEQDE